MLIDIKTIYVVLILTNVIQTIAFYYQYKLNPETHGISCWAAGIFAIGASYILSLMREVPHFEKLAVLMANTILIIGLLLLLRGILSFYRFPIPTKRIAAGLIVYIAVIAFFIYIKDDIVIRRIFVAIMIAAIALTTSFVLFFKSSEQTRLPARALAGVFFLCFGLFFSRAVISVFGPPLESEFIATPSQVFFYLGVLSTNIMWTFGFIILVNQNLHAETVEAHDRMETILNTSPDAILLTRLADGKFVDVNRKFTEQFGFTKEEVLGKTTIDINLYQHPSDRIHLTERLNREGKYEHFETTFLRKDGQPLHIILSGQVIQLGKVAHIVSIVHDISDRIITENALRESEAKFRFMTENSSDVIWHMDADYRFDYVSPADERMRGYTQEEVLGNTVWSLLKPEGVEHVLAVNRQRLEQEKQGIKTGVITYELEQKCKDGSWIWTEISVLPYRDPDGKLIGYNGVTREITERKKLQQELHRQATTDELTGLYNRRMFLELFSKELKRVERHFHPLTLMMIDIDHFKEINDSYGHSAGDETLRQFAQICLSHIREVDILARLGGDEFVILFPETTADQAEIIGMRIRDNLDLNPGRGVELPAEIFICCGIATLQNQHETLDELLNHADDALYVAKKSGRNQIRVYPSMPADHSLDESI